MEDLRRFMLAQEGAYATALAELRDGAKRTHWMWFVFPQIAGLGRSPAARRFAMRDIGEARAFLAHELLGARLREATGVTAAWAERRTLQEIFGPLDALKFVSCMTLFEAAAGTGGPPDYAAALDTLAGGVRDRHTLAQIAA